MILSDGRCTICGTIVQPNCVHSCAGSEPNSSLPHTHYVEHLGVTPVVCPRCWGLQRQLDDAKADAASWLQQCEDARDQALKAIHEVSDLRAALALQAQERQWQPIDSAPRDDSYIMVWQPDAGCHVALWTERDIEWWHVDDGKNGPFPLRGPEPTHWMPLPDAPSLPSAAAPVKENT